MDRHQISTDISDNSSHSGGAIDISKEINFITKTLSNNKFEEINDNEKIQKLYAMFFEKYLKSPQ